MPKYNRISFRVILSIGVILLLLFLVNTLGIFQFLRMIMTPVERLAYELHSDSAVVPTNDSQIELLQKLSDLDRLMQENEELRALLNFNKTLTLQSITANVISYDPNSETYIFIDQGIDQGITIGLPVVNPKGIVVGKIIQVTNTTSQVELITGSSSRLAVTTLENPEVKGIIRGYLSTSMKLEYVLEKEKIAVGSTIVTSGLEPLVPKNLLVGVVQSVEQSTDQLFVNALIEPIADLNSLTIVSVLKPL